MLKTYQGSCHCGAVRFEAELDLTQPSFRCNCSICRRNRFWAAVAKEGQFRLIVGEDMLTEYRFNTKKNQHFFCKVCGVRGGCVRSASATKPRSAGCTASTSAAWRASRKRNCPGFPSPAWMG